MAPSQSARWCFTLNNYTEDDILSLDLVDCKYMIYGKEIAPTSGTPHLQGYVQFRANKRLSWVKKLNSNCHWEVAIADAHCNTAYCSKERDVTTRGVLPKTPSQKGQDEKERWIQIIAHAKAGTLEEHDPKVYYNSERTAERLHARYGIVKGYEKTVKVYWGATGTGKSHDAWEEAGELAYGKDPRTKWWDGYHDQENVVIDEFRGTIDISHMLRWLDKYPVRVETKGSTTPLKVIRVWITSNLHPKDWYPDLDQETKDALMRRLEVTQYHKPYGTK